MRSSRVLPLTICAMAVISIGLIFFASVHQTRDPDQSAKSVSHYAVQRRAVEGVGGPRKEPFLPKSPPKIMSRIGVGPKLLKDPPPPIRITPPPVSFVLPEIEELFEKSVARPSRLLPDKPDDAQVVFQRGPLMAALASDIGLKEEMEDTWSISFNLENLFTPSPGVLPTHMFAVYDGHGGLNTAQFLSLVLPTAVANHPDFATDLEKAARETFISLDATYKKILSYFPSSHAYSGSTAATVIVRGDEVLCANVGDSRALLISTDGSVKPLSSDHKPSRLDEQKRVTDAGATVVNRNGVMRVNGILALTRAFGDFYCKPGVTAEPEIISVTRRPEDRFLVIASDGVFDVLMNSEVAALISRCILPLEDCAKMVIASALDRKAFDNMSVLVVDLAASQETTALTQPMLLSP